MEGRNNRYILGTSDKGVHLDYLHPKLREEATSQLGTQSPLRVRVCFKLEHRRHRTAESQPAVVLLDRSID